MKTELKNIGAWGRLHYDFLYRNNRTVINAMRLKGTLHDYLMGVDKDAEDRIICFFSSFISIDFSVRRFLGARGSGGDR